jgi:hypothetical protein
MIGVETTQEILVSLSRPAGVFDRDESGNQSQYLSRPSLRLKQILFVRDKLLG